MCKHISEQELYLKREGELFSLTTSDELRWVEELKYNVQYKTDDLKKIINTTLGTDYKKTKQYELIKEAEDKQLIQTNEKGIYTIFRIP